MRPRVLPTISVSALTGGVSLLSWRILGQRQFNGIPNDA